MNKALLRGILQSVFVICAFFTATSVMVAMRLGTNYMTHVAVGMFALGLVADVAVNTLLSKRRTRIEKALEYLNGSGESGWIIENAKRELEAR